MLLCAANGIDLASISQMTHVNDQWYRIKKSILLLQDRVARFGYVSRRRKTVGPTDWCLATIHKR